MKDKTLLVLAAGMGSRFGGLKQIEPVGPNGEFIIDYSIFDAVRSGFNKIVFIIKKENYDIFKETIGARVEKHVKVDDAIAGLPSVKIIKQDMKHLEDLCAKYRIFIGCTYPVTFDMTKDYLLGEDLLEKYGDVPKYGISIAGRVSASFTTQEFLDSMKGPKVIKKDAR